ncbi:glycogen/starch/alpha-glucan phosphorylase [Eubacteriales bacterium OttesenSCG-928-G02]|nr:glycogen/starch/alpha-glucan phosphorylase [Eubacteriales bacterium OttesenSCG-928-G02]
MQINKNNIEDAIKNKLSRYFVVTPEEATIEQVYKATVFTVRDILATKYRAFKDETKKKELKTVYYLCMEFLIGRSLKNNLNNLGIADICEEVLKSYNLNIDDIYEIEADPGLGNGGLGRLASCFMDSLASQDYPAMGFSICYQYGLFKQRLVDGEQLELPDVWMPTGDCWMVPRQDKTINVRFGGRIEEKWTENHLEICHYDYNEIEALPYDMFISGADSDGVAVLRLWNAKNTKTFDLEAYSQGQYVKAMEESTIAEAISKVLYPADNHTEGKLLRLSQQYFLVSATLQNIVLNHISKYKTLNNLSEKAAIHINDTHPALAIPELMRILMDEHNYSWDESWEIVTKTISYTNHTVLPEALETWNEDLFKVKLPRIYLIITEINRRFSAIAWEKWPGDWGKIERMSIISHGQIRMANLSVVGSHTVNGVSRLHSDILKNTIFKDFYQMFPNRFINVTNGIAHRRWLVQSNPKLANMLTELIGDGYKKDAGHLEKLLQYKDNIAVLGDLNDIKRGNKVEFSNYINQKTGIKIDPDSIFDVQVKRLHEYKRQLLNALRIVSKYIELKENPNIEMRPQTYIFGAKAAPGYTMAKDIIRFICFLAEDIEQDPVIREKLRIVFLENYNVTLAEKLIPASDVSEQISLAGKEASGTGNMKFMINGAVTIGTLDGANVEIAEEVGNDNIFIFGHTTPEVDELWKRGYASSYYYNRSEKLKKAIDYLQIGFNGRSFSDIANYLLFSPGISDPFMCLADFDYYSDTHKKMSACYEDRMKWAKMSLVNIAKAGKFAADRSIKEYAENIWGLEQNK